MGMPQRVGVPRRAGPSILRPTDDADANPKTSRGSSPCAVHQNWLRDIGEAARLRLINDNRKEKP
jgi:hypothetical protein